MAIGFQVTFDAANPDALAHFWAEVLGYIIQPPPQGFDSWDAFLDSIGVPADQRDTMSAVVDPDKSGPRILFQKVPESKTVKNRVHLDVNVGGPLGTPLDERKKKVADHVARAESLGARKLYEIEEPGEFWVTLADPEGNEFCMQ
jgi:hypothetical protein